MEIKAAININTLQAINRLWQHLEFDSSQQGKLDQSICEFTASRFMKKQIGRLGKDPKKDFTITLQLFEAITIEKKLRQYKIFYDQTSQEYNNILLYCNKLHPQTI